jgi:hypothetical protein
VLTAEASAAIGVACDDDAKCRSGMCAIEGGSDSGYCSDLCCSDDDCGNSEQFVCRPAEGVAPNNDVGGDKGASWSLRCVPK